MAVGWTIGDESPICIWGEDLGDGRGRELICNLHAPHGNVYAERRAHMISAAPEMLDACHRIVSWLDRLAAQSDKNARSTRFPSYSDACRADAKNYRATAATLRAVIVKAEGRDA